MFTMVGLPDASVRESRDRVRSAIRNSGFEFPAHRITVNLAPADVRKAGASFDLPIALGILAAQGVVERRHIADLVLLGELSLDGSIHAARGVLPIAAAAKRDGLAGILLPEANAGEAAIVSGLDVFPVTSLAEAVRALNEPSTPPATAIIPRPAQLAKRRRSCRRSWATARSPCARSRLGRRPQSAPRRAAGRRKDDDGAARSGNPAAAHVRRGARSHSRSLGRWPASAGNRPARRSPVPGAAPHHLERGAGGRRIAAAARRGEPGAPRRAVSGRDARVQSPRPRSPAPAARGRARGDRPGGAHGDFPCPVHARRRDESVPLRVSGRHGSRVSLHAAAGRALPRSPLRPVARSTRL